MPINLTKLMFLLILDDVPSERELMESLPERLDHLWFLGGTLGETTPYQSVISKARTRWGKEVFGNIFRRPVQKSVEAGMVGGKKIQVDSSFIAAHAFKDWVIKSSPGLIASYKKAVAAGIRPHPDPLQDKPRKPEERAGLQEEKDFTYHKKCNLYRCPAGQEWKRRWSCVPAGVYAVCGFAGPMHTAAAGRSVQRHEQASRRYPAKPLCAARKPGAIGRDCGCKVERRGEGSLADNYPVCASFSGMKSLTEAEEEKLLRKKTPPSPHALFG